MTVTIELSAELETGLAALAAAQGIAVPEYVQHLLAEQVPTLAAALSSAEKVAVWRDVENLPVTPFLSDADISREALYGLRG